MAMNKAATLQKVLADSVLFHNEPPVGGDEDPIDAHI
jgi:hypothetical protein